MHEERASCAPLEPGVYTAAALAFFCKVTGLDPDVSDLLVQTPDGIERRKRNAD